MNVNKLVFHLGGTGKVAKQLHGKLRPKPPGQTVELPQDVTQGATADKICRVRLERRWRIRQVPAGIYGAVAEI